MAVVKGNYLQMSRVRQLYTITESYMVCCPTGSREISFQDWTSFGQGLGIRKKVSSHVGINDTDKGRLDVMQMRCKL